MDKNKLRLEIATDLRGKSSRNSDSLIPEIAKKFEISTTEVLANIQSMQDLRHVLSVNGGPSIRLTENGEIFYFSTKKHKVMQFIVSNWPHITSNLIAIIALIIALLKSD